MVHFLRNIKKRLSKELKTTVLNDIALIQKATTRDDAHFLANLLVS
jgi:hypothetical protein